MTRRNKHAARFCARYRPWIGSRKFTDAVLAAQPVIHRMTEAFRRYHEAMQTPPSLVDNFWGNEEPRWTYVPHIANVAAPTVAELEAGTPIDGLASVGGPGFAERWLRDYNRVPASAGTYSGWDAVDIVSRPDRHCRLCGLRVWDLDSHRRQQHQPDDVDDLIIDIDPGDVEFGPPPARSPAEFVQYADDVLDAVGYDPMYPEPHEHTDEPWPYRGF